VRDARAAELLELIRKSPANHDFFFNGLDDPGWLAFLRQNGYFTSPIEPIQHRDGIQYPFWPESRYLVRVARQAPDEVLGIAEAIPESENVRVHEDVLRIANQLPGPAAARLARREARWLRRYEGHLMSLADAAGTLMAHLADNDETAAAFTLAGALLAIPADASLSTSRRRVPARISAWEYGQILETYWPKLAAREPRKAFKFLCGRLADVIEVGYSNEGHDSTQILRHAIASQDRNLADSLLDLLVNVVRDSAVALAETDAEFVIAELEHHPQPLFARLRLFVLAEQGTPDAVASALLDSTLAGIRSPWTEYGPLLKKRFVELGPADKQRLLEMVTDGPGVILTPELEERGVTQDDIDRSSAQWQLRRYHEIAEHLDGTARATYERLLNELGPPPPLEPSMQVSRATWSAGSTPLTADELTTLGPREAARAIRERSQSLEQGESPEAFAAELASAAASEPGAFSAHAREFEGLEPTYARALIGAFTEAVKAGSSIEWEPALALCAWGVAQPRDAGAPAGEVWDRDPDWTWTRRQVISLLTAGFADSAAVLPPAQRAMAWALIAELAEDPDPDPRGGADADSDAGFDAATRSINSVRGEAMHAAARYVLWVERTAGDFAGMQSVPEARTVFERHVDPEVDNAPAIRSVYGQWFAQFVRIDSSWAESMATRIFPTVESESAQFAAAWEGYVVFTPPYDEVFALIVDAYAIAVDRLDPQADKSRLAGDPREHLGDHLLAFTIRSRPRAQKLFERFWAKAPSPLRHEVIAHAGWTLERSGNLPAELARATEQIWNWIFEATAEEDPNALASFGTWLASSTLDGAWLLERASAVLARRVHLWPDDTVYEAAARLAGSLPAESMSVVRAMIETDEEGWSVYGAADALRNGIVTALATEGGGSQARAVIELLTARGLSGYDELLG
jgi:hypothetical protein